MATVYQRGKHWYLQWSEGGQRYRRSLGPCSRTEAERTRKVKEAELASGMDLLSSVPRFSEFAVEYLDWYKHEHPSSYDRTAQIIRTHLEPVFGPLGLDQIGPYQAEQMKTRRRAAGVKNSTITKELFCLKAMLNRAVDWGVLDTHPCPRVKPPTETDSKPPRWYTKDELERIYSAATDEHRWIWQLMVNTGLRRGEALMLRAEWDHGDFLHVLSDNEARTKSGRWRKVPVTPRAREALGRLSQEGYVLPHVNPRSLSRAFRLTLQRAGLDGNLHCLRHTFCSHLVMEGVPLRTVQVLAGHANSSVTEKYSHLAPDYLQGAMTKLSL